ncbi:hypothetical protein B0H19DRAFT_1064288 [Mycena capillaripes]|nr:hypothetical protein B0H19DRAFT_1064288 [Mycena capillaripes]
MGSHVDSPHQPKYNCYSIFTTATGPHLLTARRTGKPSGPTKSGNLFRFELAVPRGLSLKERPATAHSVTGTSTSGIAHHGDRQGLSRTWGKVIPGLRSSTTNKFSILHIEEMDTVEDTCLPDSRETVDLPTDHGHSDRVGEIGDGLLSRSGDAVGLSVNHSKDEGAREFGDGCMNGHAVNVRRSGRTATLRSNPMSFNPNGTRTQNHNPQRKPTGGGTARGVSADGRNPVSSALRVNQTSHQVLHPASQGKDAQSRASEALSGSSQTCPNGQDDPQRSSHTANTVNGTRQQPRQGNQAPHNASKLKPANNKRRNPKIPRDKDHAPAFFNKK